MRGNKGRDSMRQHRYRKARRAARSRRMAAFMSVALMVFIATPAAVFANEIPAGGENTSAAGIAPLVAPGSVEGNNYLKMNVADDSGMWHDVDEIGNAVDWSMTVPTKQIQVIVGFPTGYQQTRQAEIDVPAGYKIVEMSGGDHFTAPAGIKNLTFSQEDQAKVNTVTLKSSAATDAADTSPGAVWPAKLPIGPIPPDNNYYFTGISSQNLQDGKIYYTFNNNCNKITLTVTLRLDETLLPHNNTS